MTAPDELVFLLDVENALRDTEHIEAALRNHLEHEFGPESRDGYWATFKMLRAELGSAE